MSREMYWAEDPSELLRVGPGFKLATAPTDAHPGFEGNKAAGQAALAEGSLVLADLQERVPELRPFIFQDELWRH